jgi:cytosine/adenosine deaminase-related metal-dependent hydrolase
LDISAACAANTTSTLFRNGTIVAFNRETESLEVIRNGAVLVTGDRIASIFSNLPSRSDLPSGTEEVDITDKILTTGFIDTHRHGWQTAFKTLGSNTSLIEYFPRYIGFAAQGHVSAEDVYIGQLAGLYEALNAGVTTSVDHAHHTWSHEAAVAGLQASIDSNARVFWCYTIQDRENFSIDEQLADLRAVAATASFRGTPTSMGIAYDSFGPNPNLTVVEAIVGLIRCVLTYCHCMLCSAH